MRTSNVVMFLVGFEDAVVKQFGGRDFVRLMGLFGMRRRWGVEITIICRRKPL